MPISCGRQKRPTMCTSWGRTRLWCGTARLWLSLLPARSDQRPEANAAYNHSKPKNKQQAMTNISTNPNKALWEKGDFTRIANTMRESGEALVQRIGITNELKVLDLGCGDGTTALPEAKLGADVLGIDIARNLVEPGNRPAPEARPTHLR